MGNASDWPIEKLWANPDNPRRNIGSGDPSFDGLVTSIRSQGILQPLLINSDGMILAGHRRHAAALAAGLETAPVRILGHLNNHALIPLIENLQRSDLKVLEVAEYLRIYSEQYESTLVEISQTTGISTSTISKYLRLANAPVEVKERVERDEIPLNAAFELLRHDETFILEVIKTPTLTKQIVRHRASSLGLLPDRGAAHADILEHVWDRVQDGCYTPEAVEKCSECGHTIFNLSRDEIRGYLQTLVDDGRAEWRKQGGKKEMQAGAMPTLCVPADLPSGEGFEAAREKSVWSEEAWAR